MTNAALFLVMIAGSVGYGGFVGHRNARKVRRWDEQQARLMRRSRS